MSLNHGASRTEMWPFIANLMLMDGSKSNNLIATVPRIKSKHVKVSQSGCWVGVRQFGFFFFSVSSYGLSCLFWLCILLSEIFVSTTLFFHDNCVCMYIYMYVHLYMLYHFYGSCGCNSEGTYSCCNLKPKFTRR